MTLRHEPDVSHADWFARSGDDWVQLCTIGPSGFAGYARILHPTDDPPDKNGYLTCEGDLGEDLVQVLCDVLPRYTRTLDDCFFALWDGFGGIHGGMATLTRGGHGSSSWREPPAFDADVREGPQVEIPNRSYFLFRGSLEHAGQWPSRNHERINSPSLIWPADHAWFVATEIDQPWTGVGGSVELTDDLLAHDVLDVVPAAASSDLPYYRD